MGSSRFYSALAAVLFAAVCAWMGAAVFSVLPPAGRRVTQSLPQRSLQLYGIVLRREQQLPPLPLAEYEAEDGTRLAAATLLAPSDTVLSEPAIFCRSSDGYEHLSPESAAELDCKTLDALLSSRAQGHQGAKLVYGFDFYYAAFMEGMDEIEPGPCRVRFETQEQEYTACILSVSRQDERCALLLRLKMDGGDCLRLRTCRAELIL